MLHCTSKFISSNDSSFHGVQYRGDSVVLHCTRTTTVLLYRYLPIGKECESTVLRSLAREHNSRAVLVRGTLGQHFVPRANDGDAHQGRRVRSTALSGLMHDPFEMQSSLPHRTRLRLRHRTTIVYSAMAKQMKHGPTPKWATLHDEAEQGLVPGPDVCIALKLDNRLCCEYSKYSARKSRLSV